MSFRYAMSCTPDTSIGLLLLTGSTSDPEAHKQRKKLLQRGFSQASMLVFEPEIDTKIETLLGQWAKRATTGPVDVYPWLHWLAFDIVCMFRLKLKHVVTEIDVVSRPSNVRRRSRICEGGRGPLDHAVYESMETDVYLRKPYSHRKQTNSC